MPLSRALQPISAPNGALQNGQLVSRIFTDARGQSFRLTFFVSIVNGEVRGHLISAEAIYSKASNQATVHCLPFSCPKVTCDTPYISKVSSFVSPYFSTEFLINSQPTRAPARA